MFLEPIRDQLIHTDGKKIVIQTVPVRLISHGSKGRESLLDASNIAIGRVLQDYVDGIPAGHGWH